MKDDDHPGPPKILARITLRIHEGEIVASVSDEEGEITLHRVEPDEEKDAVDET